MGLAKEHIFGFPLNSARMTRSLAAGFAFLLCTASVGAADRAVVDQAAADRVSGLPPIPDVGEPFDVRKFSAVSVPDHQNAWTYYRQASRLLVAIQSLLTPAERKRLPSRTNPNDNAWEAMEQGWTHANATTRRYLRENQVALEVWKRGTDCPTALRIPLRELTFQSLGSTYYQSAREFARLAWLEAARQCAGPRPSEAWTWYRALLRSSSHLAAHAGLMGRLVSEAILNGTVDFALPWAAQPEITAADLRRALADAQAAAGTRPPFSDSMKAEYLAWIHGGVDEAIETASPELAPVLKAIGYRERLRRSANLAYANLLSHCDAPRYRRPPLSVKLRLFEQTQSTQAGETVLSAREIEKRILSIPVVDTKTTEYLTPPGSIYDALDRERVQEAALILGLALELHNREHRQFPKTLHELVAKGYLTAIPADPFGKGEPFHYRPNADPRQGAVLWSVWLDGVDQQGEARCHPKVRQGRGRPHLQDFRALADRPEEIARR